MTVAAGSLLSVRAGAVAFFWAFGLAAWGYVIVRVKRKFRYRLLLQVAGVLSISATFVFAIALYRERSGLTFALFLASFLAVILLAAIIQQLTKPPR